MNLLVNLDKNMKYLILSLGFLLPVFKVIAQDMVKYQSEDGLEVTADLYATHPKSAPFIVLFHQAGWSRGEYVEIAPKLNKMGFNCLAVDLRSGQGVNDKLNQTAQKAQRAMKPTQYLDAVPDMLGSVRYSKKSLAEGPLLIWGSSYSAALALKLAGDYPDLIDGVLAFSPGEYFSSFGESKDFVKTSAQNIADPVFITSARNEKKSWWPIYESIDYENKVFYLPETSGNHGSRALWENYNDHKGYWEAVEEFLKPYLE